MVGKAKRRQIEKMMVDDLEAFLKLAGIRVRRQLYCGYMGYADLVTDCCVYEAKVRLTSNHVKTGVGQVIIYRDYIDSDLTPVVVGGITETTNECVPYLDKCGVAVLGWMPVQDELFTANLGILEGIDVNRLKELNDQVLWRMDTSGNRREWPLRTDALMWGVGAIESESNCPVTRKANGKADRALRDRIAFREARQAKPLIDPRPKEGLYNPMRVRDDRH